MVKKMKEIKSNIALEKDYFKRLNKFSQSINKSVIKWSMARYNKSFNKNISKQLNFEFNELLNNWNNKANDLSKILSKKLTKNIENYVESGFIKQDKNYKVKNTSIEVKKALNAIYEKNVALIKTIPSTIIERFRGSFLNNVNSFDRENMYKQFKTFQGISKRRAKLIARDQTQKAVAQYTQAKSQSLGFNYYSWVTAGDERVSKGKGGHKYLNNRIYSYSEPTAVIDSYGNKGHPSQRVNCRCSQVSIILNENQELVKVKDSLRGDYYKVIEK